MIRRRRYDVLPLVLWRHPDRRAAVAAIMRQAPQDVLWRHRIFCRQRRRLAAEALEAEAGEETVRDRRIRIPRPEIFLMKTLRAEFVERRGITRLQRLRLVGQQRQSRHAEDRVDGLDH